MSLASTKGGMHVAWCDDNPHCPFRHVTGSRKGVIREQLEKLGCEVTNDRSCEGGIRVLCPGHKFKPSEPARMPPRRTY